MAQKVLLVCDLHDDDTPGSETISFCLDDGTYEIDVCAEHADELRDAFAPYVGAARRAGGRAAPPARGRGRAQRGGGGGGPDRQRTADIRTWAKEQGLKVSERGRIPATIIQQFEAAHR
jgi:hypothetical protein